MGHGPKPVRVKRFVGGQIRRFDPQQIFKRPGNVVAFRDFWRGAHCRLEPFLRFLRVLGQANRHIDDKAAPGLHRVELCPVTFYHAALFQILNPAQTGRGGQADTIGQIQIRYSPVPRQDTQYMLVDPIFRHDKLQPSCDSAQFDNYIAPISAQYAQMTIELLLALVGFAFVSSITPGPNNMMLLASGANFGLRRTVPHMAGVSLGHSFMIVVLGAGLMEVFRAYPRIQDVMTYVAVAYLLWLSWKIANAAPKTPEAPQAEGRPFTFLQAAGFQWVNPKGWFMALTALTAYTADQSFLQVLIVAGVFACTNLPSITFWTVLGQQMRRFLTSPARLRAFNWTMAALLVASVVPVFWH